MPEAHLCDPTKLSLSDPKTEVRNTLSKHLPPLLACEQKLYLLAACATLVYAAPNL